MDYKNIPNEVLFVSVVLASGRPVGQKLANQLEEIINNYPTYFPWETLYKKIPAEIHKKYNSELQKLNIEYYPRPKTPKRGKDEGLIAYINRTSKKNVWNPNPITLDQIKETFLIMESIEDKRIQFNKAKRKLWDSIYKPYKLKYKD